MSLTTVAEVRALVATSLSDVDLQDVITREEAWLARRIGALSGPRTVVLESPTAWEDIVLMRPTDEVEVEDADAATTATLIGTTIVMRGTTALGRTPWVGPTAITYTPTDEDEVKGVVIELVRGALSRSPYESETIGDYSYSRSGQNGSMPTRAGLVRSLMPGAGQPYSVRLAVRR
jgi:hypothetical protein